MIELATTEKKTTKAEQVRAYIAKNPKAKPPEIAEAVGTGLQYVYTVMWNAKNKAKAVKKAKKPMTLKEIKAATQRVQDKFFTKPNWEQLGLFGSNTSVKDTSDKITPERLAELTYAVSMGKAKARMEGDRGDPVNHPAHYKVGGIETIDFIEAKKLNYRLGNVIKYLTRADYKGNKLEDLKKAQWYLEREIWNVENNKKTA